MDRLTKNNREDNKGDYYYPECFERCDGLGTSEKCNECDFCYAVCEKLGKYEDLEEQGRLIKFPCKVGDMLYYPDKEFNIIIPVRLTEIVIKFNGLDTTSCQYDCCSFDECGDFYEDYEFDANDFGKSVFLTKSEAEAKLKELRGEENGK